MLKKLAVALVLVLAGIFVIRHTQAGSLFLAYMHDLRNRVEKKVPLEKRVEQLNLEIKKVDQSIKDEISVLAKREYEADAQDRLVKSLRARQEKCDARMKLLETAIKEKQAEVVFEKDSVDEKTVPSSAFARELAQLSREYETLGRNLSAAEQDLQSAREGVGEQEKKIRSMKEERDKLAAAVKELDQEVQKLRRKQVEERAGDDQISKTWELYQKTREQAEVEKRTIDDEKRFGLRGDNAAERKVSDEDALEMARKARARVRSEVK